MVRADLLLKKSMSGKKRITVTFRGGLLDGVMLDSQSTHGLERGDVTWLISTTSGGRVGYNVSQTEKLRSLGRPTAAGEYYLAANSENDEERSLVFQSVG